MTVGERARNLWRARSFRRYAGADAISKLGSQVTLVALPLTAAITLRASPFQVGLLTAAEMVAFLLIGLPAGAWVDRMRRRPILVATDAIRAVALLSIPVTAQLGTLSLPQLYGVALVSGVCTVFFDVAHQSYLPSIVDKDDLTRGHGVLAANFSVAELAGPGVGGWLVQLLSAPLALLADAASYLGSAVLLLGVRSEERRAEGRGVSLRSEIAEGLRFVTRHPVLRVIALTGALTMFSFGLWAAAVPLFLVRELRVSPGAYGMLLSAGALGGVAGAWLAPRVARRFGAGRTMYGSASIATLASLPVAATAPGWRLLIFPVALAASGVASTIFGVTQGAYRQSICPERLLGRLSATMRFLMWGGTPLGGLLGGTLGQVAGVRVAFWAASAGYALAHLPVVLSPRIRGV
ncbi:MFS transporter [Planotetraspora sp. A-T 1434]|uniref:MFS transporter n=1 Tax=Planotetraspora sp. A-T 1434 TaxID=2979219 RepID=UPI0021BE91CE|nr:MFS transporter [Planotetraspora sp. A-T 1434]MCT9931421.1 MFS transporter [Planotetraspora sp. A-T 1434]